VPSRPCTLPSIVTSTTMNDTIEQPIIAPGKDDTSTATLRRIAGGLELLASVLAAFPEKNPALWKSAESAKQSTDLTLACEHLREYARQLEDIVGNPKR
jgi:hypothetical protein